MVSITAINIGTGKTKWEHKVEFPSLVSPLVTNGLVFSGYIPFAEKPCIKYTITPFGINSSKASIKNWINFGTE